MYGEAPTRQIHSIPVAVSESDYQVHQKKNKSVEAVVHFKYFSRVVLSRVQPTFHATRPTPHGASRLVQAMSAWLVKTQRAPSRHCRATSVYGHTTYGHARPAANEYAHPSTVRISKMGSGVSGSFFYVHSWYD